MISAAQLANISDRSACAVWGVLRDNRSVTDVTTARSGGRHRAFLVAHQRVLDPRDRTELRGIPVTTLARALLDLAATRPAELPTAMERAEELRLFDLRPILDVLDRHRGHRGAARLRAEVGRYEPVDPHLLRSKLELGVLRLIERHGLPMPAVNLWLYEWEVDLHWTELRDDPQTVVETLRRWLAPK